VGVAHGITPTRGQIECHRVTCEFPEIQYISAPDRCSVDHASTMPTLTTVFSLSFCSACNLVAATDPILASSSVHAMLYLVASAFIAFLRN